MSTPREASARAQVLTLAALLECGACVDSLARDGRVENEAAHALCNSLLQFEWLDIEEVYGNPQMLRRGLQHLESALGLTPGRNSSPAMRYALALIHLGKRVGKDHERLAMIRARLEQLPRSGNRFDGDFDALAEPLAAIYQDTISTYHYRIKVTGNADRLRDSATAARIRALLLAGIRTAILWRFVGGSLPRLLLDRGALARSCRRLLADT